MNVQFSNKLSQMAFCHAMSNPKHQPQLQSWLLQFFQGGWRTLAGDIPRAENNRPHFTGWEGHLVRLTINARNTDTQIVDDLPITKEFDWSVELVPIDKYGEANGDAPFSRANFVMSGGLVNHGTWEDPEWSSHT